MATLVRNKQVCYLGCHLSLSASMLMLTRGPCPQGGEIYPLSEWQTVWTTGLGMLITDSQSMWASESVKMCTPASPGTDQRPTDSCKAHDEFGQGRGRMHKRKVCGHGWTFRPHTLALAVHSAIMLHNDKGMGREVSNSNNNVCILDGNRGFTTLDQKSNPSEVLSSALIKILHFGGNKDSKMYVVNEILCMED